MKVLIGPNNVANQAYYLAKYLREYGVDATCVVYRGGNRFNYDADWVVRLDADHLKATGLTPSDVYRQTLGKAFDEGFDLFHFYQSSLIPGGVPIAHNLLKGLDIPLIRQRGARVVYRFTGWEIRNRELDLARNPYSPFKHGSTGCPDPVRRDQYVKFLKQHVDAFVVADPQMHENIPEAHIIPRILNLADFPEIGVENKRRPLVIHAPSNRTAKGSEYVIQALEKCRERGADFDLELIEDMPFNEALERYKRADLVIDQVLIGWHGVLTMECLAMGKPVAVYVREDLLKGTPYEDIPIININLDNMADKLFEAITNPQLRADLSARARAYMARHHDVAAVIPRTIDLYKGVMASPVVPSGTDDVAYVLSYRDELRRLQTDLRDSRAVAKAGNLSRAGAKQGVPAAASHIARRTITDGASRVMRALVEAGRVAGQFKISGLGRRTKADGVELRNAQAQVRKLIKVNENLKTANQSLRSLHAPWVVFMSSGALMAENAVRQMTAAGIVPDVVIGHDVTTLETMRSMHRKWGCVQILDAVEFTEISERTGSIFRTYSDEGLEILQARLDTLISEVDHMFSVGPAIARELSRRHGRVVEVVSNARNAAPLPTSNFIRQEIGAAGSDVVCVFPNLIAQGYGFEEVLEAFRRLPSHFKLVHVGRIAVIDGYREKVQSLMRESRLQGRIFSLGEVPYADVPRILSGADLGIVCLLGTARNIQLAFPNRFHDLVAAGVPILSTAIEDIETSIRTHELGDVLPSHDPEVIAERITACIAKAQEYRASIRIFRETNTWENEAARMLARVPESAKHVCLIVKKDVTNHGRTHRLIDSLLAAGKAVTVVAPTGTLPIEAENLRIVHAREGLLNKG